MEKNMQHVRFLFDPACPWGYRASLWLRDVAKKLPINIEWKLFSLEYINREQGETPYLKKLMRNRQAMRLLALAEETAGQSGMDSLYLEFGRAAHENKESLGDTQVLVRALTAAGLPLTLLEKAHENPELDARLLEQYTTFREAGAFGVPTLYFNESPHGFYGPLIKVIPQGEEAIQLWEHVSGLANLPYFFELKRA